MILTNKDGSTFEIPFDPQKTESLIDKLSVYTIITLDRSLYLIDIILKIRSHIDYFDAEIPQEIIDELNILSFSGDPLVKHLNNFIGTADDPDVSLETITDIVKDLVFYIRKFFQRIVDKNEYNKACDVIQNIVLSVPKHVDSRYITSYNFYLNVFLYRTIYLLESLRDKKAAMCDIKHIFNEISYMPLTDESKKKIFCLKSLYDNGIEIPESVFNDVIISINYNGYIERSGRMDYLVDSN